MQDLPDYLKEAYQLFKLELSSHLGELGSQTVTLEMLREGSEQFEQRFHTIKGGAGFLKLERISALASEGEEMFKFGPLDEKSVQKFADIKQSLQEELEKLD